MNEFIVMVGIVGSGKSTLASSYSRFLTQSTGTETIILSSDAIREEILGDINDQTQNDKVFNTLHKRIKENIDTKNVIVDATNVSYKSRKALLNCVKKKECIKKAIIMTTPVFLCKERNANRSRVVPEFVIDKQVRNFHIPFYEEGFDEIYFDNWNEASFNSFKTGWNLKEDYIFKYMKNFNQKNSHHLYTLDEHCLRTTLELVRPCWKVWDNKPLIRAATIHDIGKLYTGEEKTDGSGNWSYIGHMCYGTYSLLTNLDALGFNNKKDILECLFYINYHMEPFFWLSTNKKTGKQEITLKTEKKMKELYGEEKYNLLRLFNLADRIGSGSERENVKKDKKEMLALFKGD